MRGPQGVAGYYDQELQIAEASGAGMIWFMGRDHLSPPLSNADRYALDASQWPAACIERVVALSALLDVDSCDRVLDLGCGIGGPGRAVATATGADVSGVSISFKQLRNLRRLSDEPKTCSPYRAVVQADMARLPVADESVDGVFSVNAVYHVNTPDQVIAESHRVLRRGGRFAVDDWFTTDRTTPTELAMLRYNWSTGSNGFHHFDDFSSTMELTGFKVVHVVDFTAEAGGFLSEGRFGATYDTQVAPRLLEVFPRLYQYEGYVPEHAQQAVDQLRSDILFMGTLYRSGAAVYRQIVGEKL